MYMPVLPVKAGHGSSQGLEGQFRHADGQVPRRDGQPAPFNGHSALQRPADTQHFRYATRQSHAGSQQSRHAAEQMPQQEGRLALHTVGSERQRHTSDQHFSLSEQPLQRMSHRPQPPAEAASSKPAMVSKLTHSSGSSAHRQKEAQLTAKPVGLLSLLLGLGSALVDGHEVAEHDAGRQQGLCHKVAKHVATLCLKD